jgi:predicted deacylase
MTTEVVKKHMVVAQNASGRNMNVPIYRMKGARPGPTVYIQSSIHGAEVQGNVGDIPSDPALKANGYLRRNYISA